MSREPNESDGLGWEQQARMDLDTRLESLPYFEQCFGNSSGYPVDQAESVWWGV
jgi:hypothetical protein